MGKITWEYLAGFTDGEGSLGVVGKGTRITWGNTDKAVMDAIVEFLRGHGFPVNYYSVEKKAPWKRIYMANITQKKEMLRIINLLQPLVITKVFQCENVRQWILAKDKKSSVDFDTVMNFRKDGFSWADIAKTMHIKYLKLRNLLIDRGVLPNMEYSKKQLTYRARDDAQKSGKCINCFQPRGDNGTQLHCRPCADRRNDWKRNRLRRKRCAMASQTA